MPTISSNATPRMIRWAREKAGYSVEAVAKVEAFAEQDILDWESGKESPSLPRLRKLAKRYKRPLMVFYMQAPPKEFNVVRNFRLLPEASRRFSPALLYAIRSAKERQQWASEYLRELGAPKCDLVRSIKMSDVPKAVGIKLRALLDVSIERQFSCQTKQEAFKLWRDACERLGVFVFQSNQVEVDEMRGCAIADDYAPIALVNSRDADTAKCFTMIHEVVHIAIGESTITTRDAIALAFATQSRVERFCNEVAAEVLVPSDDILIRVPNHWDRDDEGLVARLANRYRVSRAVIAIRLVELGLAEMDWLSNKWAMFHAKPEKEATELSERPIPQYRIALSRSGTSFAKLVISAYNSGEIHGGQLTSLLNMPLKHLARMVHSLCPVQMQPNESGMS
jgi:Zn-dependent peptidase ImmA (M78 family)/transcriptional regulator with XRE-family HTH domain